jgi:F-type H+-transporting ATPase subunit gamma
MTAMENATGNADDVIKKLTLLANKTRQSMITTELMDIVNGTEALRKGGAD